MVFMGGFPVRQASFRWTKFADLSSVNIIRLDQPTLGALAAVYGTLSTVGRELEKMKI